MRRSTNVLTGDDRPIGGARSPRASAVKHPGKLTLPIVRDLVSEIVIVEEDLIESAVKCLRDPLQRTMAEGSRAQPGSRPCWHARTFFAGRDVGVVLCGGNIDARILASVMVRELERDERIVAFRIYSHDRPGLLGRVPRRGWANWAPTSSKSRMAGSISMCRPRASPSISPSRRAMRINTARVFAALRDDGYEPRRIDPRGPDAGGPLRRAAE